MVSSESIARVVLRTDVDWLLGHFESLYEVDGEGRLLAAMSPGGGLAPRFHLGRTRLGAIWRFSRSCGPDTVRALSRLASREPAIGPDVRGAAPPPPERLEPFRRILEESAPIEHVWRGPAYRFPFDPAGDATGGDPAIQPGSVVLADLADQAEVIDEEDDPRIAELAAHFDNEIDELTGRLPIGLARHEGVPVSICTTARGLPSTFVQAGVETTETARGRGHAPRCVAAWARAIRDRGGEPLFSTAWSNRASLSVARKLGLVRFAEDWHFS